MPKQTGPAVLSLREAWRYLGRLVKLLRPHWHRFTTSVALALVVGCTALVTPYLSKLLIDAVYPSHDTALMHLLVFGLLAVSVATTIMSGLRGLYSQVLSAQLASATGLLFFNHLQHLPTHFFDNRRVGEIMSRFGDVRAALSALSTILQTLLGSGVYVVLAPPILLLLNWKLALVALAPIPVTTSVTALAGKRVRTYWKRSAEAAGELSALQVEVFSHVRSLKAMGVERQLFRAARLQAEAVVRGQLTASGYAAAVTAMNGLVRALGTAGFTWYAWTLILQRQMTLGDFIAFSAYIGLLTGPANQLASLFSSFQQTSVTLGRMFEYLDEPVEQDPSLVYEGAPVVRRARGELRLVDVTFGYRAGQPVVRGVSLTLSPGTVTALVGASGVGKSSLLRLLCRMAEPESGAILLDDLPVAAVPLAELRAQIAVVWQEFALFRGTVWDNLTFGLEDVPDGRLRERVHEAVRICGLEPLLTSLPEGYDTPVGEWGATLSGGQRQRLAIARALVRDTPVLLLDEATSQVDVGTEEEMLSKLFANVRDKTVLLVTHRISTATLADQVCMLVNGEVVGHGSHEQLAATCEPYRRLLKTVGVGDTPRPLQVLGV